MAQKKVVTPDVGGEAEVTVIEVLVKPGDTVQADTPVVTLESDKATMEVPAGEAGTVKNIKVKLNDKLATGDLILTLDADGAEDTSAPEEKVATSSQQSHQPVEDDEDEDVLVGEVETVDSSEVHAGPGVRRMARELGVNLSQVVGSGPRQRILKEDLQTFVKTQLTQVQTGTAPLNLPSIDFTKFGEIEARPLSRIQKISGKNLQRNWMMIPHVTQFGEADITSLEDFRKQQKHELDKKQIKLTPIVFVMKAAVASMKAFPQFNASLDASGENLILKKYFNVGVAVDTPDGLVVPVIRDVDKKGLIDLAKELAEVSERARKKQLTPADMQGGCFSISSLGGIGGTAFTPIINYPEVAILGVSRTSIKPVYEEGEFVPRMMLPLSLSYDHRVVDGADGARFMMHLTNMLSDIRNLLL